MSDLSRLFKDAAAQPERGPDVEAAIRDGRRRYVARSVVALTSVVALLATSAVAVRVLQSDDPQVVSPGPVGESGLIAFTTQAPDDMSPWIAVTPVAGGPITRLHEGSSPSWSPDGTRIAFSCGGICTMNADGTTVRKLTEPKSGVIDESPSWGPTGEIVFARNYMDGGPRDIGVVDEKGGENRIITGDPSDDYSPEWSPDGEEIVFIRVRGGTLESSRTGGQPWVMKPDGSDVQRATGLPGSPDRPAWSPDGRHIAFDDGGNTIWIVPTKGGAPTVLKQTGSFVSWSPDGDQIAFTCAEPTNDNDICIVDVDGSNREAVVDTSDNEADPDWQSISSVEEPELACEEAPLTTNDAHPCFDSLPGWRTADTGRTETFVNPTAWAWTADLELEFPEFPTHLLPEMSEEDVFITVELPMPEQRPAEPNESFPSGEMPLSLDNARLETSWEGQPDDDVVMYRLSGTIEGMYVDARVYVNDDDPSNETLQRADAQLQRLVLPLSKAPRGREETDDALSELPRGWSELPAPPEARVSAATAWTGDELIVWSGYVYTGYSDEVAQEDGFSFEARTKTWKPIAESPLQARSSPASAWTGTELLVWGGAQDTGYTSFFADGAAYAPTTDSWRELPPAPISARAPLSVWTGRELIVWGSGPRSEDGISTDGAAYDPVEDSWRTLADAPIGLGRATAIWTGHEMIILGDAGKGKDGSSLAPAAGIAYDPATDSWRRLPDSNLSNNASTASWNGDEMIAWDYIQNTAAYDPDTDAWRTLPTVPLEDYECSPKSTPIGRHVLGDFCGQTALFDPSEDRWRNITRNAGLVGWGFTLHSAGDFALIMGTNTETSEKSFFAYRP